MGSEIYIAEREFSRTGGFAVRRGWSKAKQPADDGDDRALSAGFIALVAGVLLLRSRRQPA